MISRACGNPGSKSFRTFIISYLTLLFVKIDLIKHENQNQTAPVKGIQRHCLLLCHSTPFQIATWTLGKYGIPDKRTFG